MINVVARWMLSLSLVGLVFLGLPASAQAQPNPAELAKAGQEIETLDALHSRLAAYLGDAPAAIRPLEEAPGQIVYQSRQVLTDQRGDRWQAIVFKRIRSTGRTSLNLRLVGFPGKAEVDRTRALTLTSALGQTLTAQAASSQIFTDAAAPAANVGQYDLQPIVAQLPAAIPMQIHLPLVNQEDRLLSLSPALIQEWKTLSTYDYSTVNP